MKRCELCKNRATIFCEADEAHLCWDCDHTVHSANFLVANHTRSLLCHTCQSPTTWQGSSNKLPLTVSVCHACVRKCHKQSDQEEEEEISENNYEEYIENDDETESEDEDESDDDDDDDIQVVPWSSDLSSSPPEASSSSRGEVSTLKRSHDSDDENGCASSRLSTMEVASSPEAMDRPNSHALSFSRPHKRQKTNEEYQTGIYCLTLDETQSGSVGMMLTSLRRLGGSVISQDSDPSSAILAICKMSRDSEAL